MPAQDPFIQYLLCRARPDDTGTRAKAQQRQLDEIVAWQAETQSLDTTHARCHAALKDVEFELFSFSNDDTDFDYLTGQRAALQHALAWKFE